MGILPDGLGDDERGLGVEVGEDRHAFFLGADETVFLRGLVGMGADELVAEFRDGGGEGLLHRVLGGPADFVGGLAEVAVSDEQNGFEFGHGRKGGVERVNAWLENLVRQGPGRMHSIPAAGNG